MSDFYSIKDPSLELEHAGRYFCLDDWDNVFIAEYDACIDMFFLNIENDSLQYRINFLFNDEDGYYYACEPALSYYPHQITREDFNPLSGNKIEKVRKFDLDIRGIK